MTSTDRTHDDAGFTWERIGRAAEDFARRVARDATKFAERIEEHAGDFARDISRDWRRAERHCRHGYRQARRFGAAPEVRQVFDDIRTVVADVLEGIDELIGQIFAAPPDAAETEWVRVVANRDTTCSACARSIAAGEHGFVRRTSSGIEARCADCGVPPPAADSAS